MTNRGCLGRVLPCAALRNMSSAGGCGVGAYSSKSVYSGTGGRGTIMRGEAIDEDLQFPEYDHMAVNRYPPIELDSNQHIQYQNGASQHRRGTQESEDVENMQSLETRRAEVLRALQEREVKSTSAIKQQIPQQMNSPVRNKMSEHFYQEKHDQTFPMTKSRSVPRQLQNVKFQNQPDLQESNYADNPLHLQTNRVVLGRQAREAKPANSIEQYRPEQVYSSAAIKTLQHFKQQEGANTFPVANLRSVARQQYPSSYVEKTDTASVRQSPYSQDVKRVYISQKLQPGSQEEYENTFPSKSASSTSMPNQQNASNKTQFYLKTPDELAWAENLQDYSHSAIRKSKPVYYQKYANASPKINAVTSKHVRVQKYVSDQNSRQLEFQPQKIQPALPKSGQFKKPTQYAASYDPNELWTNQMTESRRQIPHLSKTSFLTDIDASGDNGQKGHQETRHFADNFINPLVPVTHKSFEQDYHRKRVDLVPNEEADVMQRIGGSGDYVMELDPANCFGLQVSGE